MFAINYYDDGYPMVKIAMSENELKGILLRLRNDRQIVPYSIIYADALTDDRDVTSDWIEG